MLKLLFTPNQSGVPEELLRRVGGPGGDGDRLLIVPEQYSHETERRLCRVMGNTAAARGEVLSFTQLSRRVFGIYGGSARPVLDAGGRILLMAQAVRSLSGTLRVYARSSRKAAFLRELMDTADECKSCCISPEMLIRAGEETEARDDGRLRELGMILSAYDSLTQQLAEDPRDRLTRLERVLGECDYLRGKDIYFACFTDFTPQEKLVLARMLKKARGVTVALRCDTPDPAGAGVYSSARRTAHVLTELAREQGVGMEYEVFPEEDTHVPEMRHLEKMLFSAQGQPFPSPTDAVTVTRGETPHDEVELAAEEILRLVREEGYRYRDITVAARSLEQYGDLVETVFSRYDIPLFLSRMEDILQKPVLTLITAALDCVTRDYEYEDVFRYLKTGLTGISPEERDELENYVLRWDLRGAQWTGEKPWNWHPGGYSLAWTEEDRASVERLDVLRRRIIGPMEKLRRVSRGSGAELTRALYAFLEEISLPESLHRRVELLTESSRLKEAEEYRQLWDILVLALEQCSDILSQQTLTRDEFADLFRLVLSQYQVGAIPVSLDRVTVGDLPRVSHTHTQILFFIGADDASVPQINRQRGLLTEDDRRYLSDYGMDTGLTPDQQMEREMSLIYECCTLPSRRLYLTWPGSGTDGAGTQPAFFLSRIEELFPFGKRMEHSRYPSAPVPAVEQAAFRGDRKALAALAEGDSCSLAGRTARALDFQRGSLSPESVRELYGENLNLSASRMDKVRSCHYGYFLQYGLKAKPRRPAGFDAPETGTFIHYVLEHVLREARKKGGAAALSDDRIREMSRSAVEQYIREELGGLENKTPRFRYLFRRLSQSAALVVEHMVEELRCSKFEPVAFELGFGAKNDLPPIRLEVDGFTVSVSGFVDRVDGWVHDGRLYLRVLDYKTGRKSFDFTDIWHGLNLQMLLYLFALEEQGKSVFGNVEIVPAGVLYLPARDVVLKGERNMGEESFRKSMDTQLKRSGLLLRDEQVLEAMEHVEQGESARFLPVTVNKKSGAISGDSLATAEQMGKLREHVRQVLTAIGRELGSGSIKADPWYKNDRQGACRFCDYAQACHFEDGCRGEASRYLYPVETGDFWQLIHPDEEEEKQVWDGGEEEQI